ncbi:MAG TPA: tRNA (adenosine(37)-N6)-threonylcarbamoyltransferase complex dimerization subunit type 1 TsaB [Terriglobales bacterium]|nr:tRNA (adenosine(37)-N6)-threonylcarbamoyltransferase complex dimerization subunit type 1 TsaB [Terriglobales bacterium]
MLLLAADTSGKHGSIALARADQQGFQVMEAVPLAGGTFSAQLVPQIAELLGRHGVCKRQLDGFVVASGPGSFTGLRVGLAAIKGLAEILHKPIAAVSILEVLALAAQFDGLLVSALDAGRGEAYTGEYAVAAGNAQFEREGLLNEEEFVALARGRRGTVVTPDALILGWGKKHGFEVAKVEYPRSDALARVGWKKLLAGESVEPAELEANYIRRSDAEIFAKQESGVRSRESR